LKNLQVLSFHQPEHLQPFLPTVLGVDVFLSEAHDEQQVAGQAFF
jgi:hypothetical protein